MRKSITFLFLLIVVLSGCKRQEPKTISIGEDRQAKKLLQGIWVNDDDDDVAFRAKGDTIYYPDSTSQPVYFRVVDDSLCLKGAVTTKYAIKKLSDHLFVFKNQSGEEVKLTKEEDVEVKAEEPVETKQPVAINQRRVIKNDTVVMLGNVKNHIYIQVNPTTYKVTKSSYNNEGVLVDNIYYDNTVSICIVKNSVKTFIHDFYKKEFADIVPSEL